ncbi:MAG: hypothetical protein IPH20_20230 [Bacteroidales bacterium]|nr:hypothetical protein [Bacteroidales bacterium]
MANNLLVWFTCHYLEVVTNGLQLYTEKLLQVSSASGMWVIGPDGLIYEM